MLTIRYSSRFVILLAAFAVMTATSAVAADETDASIENELLAVLRSDAAPAEKAIACKKLAIHGSAESVPDLAKLLPDPQLSSWARIAIEAIPGKEADEALRNAADSLDGRLLIGMINSIGVRRDNAAVESLIKRLEDSDAAVASAAAVALGHIGNDAAVAALRESLASAPANVRSAVAEGCVLCAEQMHAAGNAEQATAIYDEVRSAKVPLQRIIEATRGAILARGEDGLPLLQEQFQSEEKAMFQLALATARECPGSDVDQALVVELDRVPPARAALLIQAMADRPDTVILPAVLKSAEEGPEEVRLSAINALRRVGDQTCLASLLNIALEPAPESAVKLNPDVAVKPDAEPINEVAQAAKEAVAVLADPKVDVQILAMLPKAEGKMYPLLIELVGQRRIDAVPDLLKALDHSDKTVRTAALVALGQTVSLKRLPVLIAQLIEPKNPEDLDVAQAAVKAASIRMPDREACAVELAAALDAAPAGTKTTLLEILSDVGGSNALQTLAEAAKSNDDEMQDAGSRLLGKWNSVAAAPVLLDLAKTAPDNKYRVRALRGYIGLARKFAMPDPERAEMCQNAMDVATRLDEKKLVLDVLELHPSAETLKLAINAMEVPALKAPATQTTLAIAQKLGGKGVDMTQLLAAAGLEKVDLEIIKAEYGAGETKKDVTEVVRKQAGSVPVITLVSSSYNSSFGGDPAPGTTKQLTIQYRINGKSGQASFAENSLIILPMPK